MRLQLGHLVLFSPSNLEELRLGFPPWKSEELQLGFSVLFLNSKWKVLEFVLTFGFPHLMIFELVLSQQAELHPKLQPQQLHYLYNFTFNTQFIQIEAMQGCNVQTYI